jgi:transposase-like protein
VLFTNNLAEKDFRPLKVKNKIAGYFKTPESLKTFLVNFSILKTAIKSKLNKSILPNKKIICNPSVILS